MVSLSPGIPRATCMRNREAKGDAVLLTTRSLTAEPVAWLSIPRSKTTVAIWPFSRLAEDRMKKLSVRVIFLLVALSVFAVGLAYGDTIVTFPSDNSFSCNVDACDFIGNLNHQSEPLFTAGDFVTEIFFTGQTAINSLAYDFSLINGFGGNPGNSYENDLYVNGVSGWQFPCARLRLLQQHPGVQGHFSFSPLRRRRNVCAVDCAGSQCSGRGRQRDLPRSGFGDAGRRSRAEQPGPFGFRSVWRWPRECRRRLLP